MPVILFRHQRNEADPPEDIVHIDRGATTALRLIMFSPTNS